MQWQPHLRRKKILMHKGPGKDKCKVLTLIMQKYVAEMRKQRVAPKSFTQNISVS